MCIKEERRDANGRIGDSGHVISIHRLGGRFQLRLVVRDGKNLACLPPGDGDRELYPNLAWLGALSTRICRTRPDTLELERLRSLSRPYRGLYNTSLLVEALGG